MLKRKDLVDQFEYLFQQEIKTHQDNILATNISLNKFREQLLTLKKDIGKEIAKLNKSLVDQKIEKDNNLLDIDKKIETLSGSHAVTNALIKVQESNVNDQLHKLELGKVRNQDLAALKDEFAEFRKNTCEVLSQIRDTVNGSFVAVNEKINSEIKKLRDEFKERPSHISEIKKELLQKIEEYRIDSQSLIREVQGNKKLTFIQEKKIENLYTITQRIKSKLED